MKKLVTNATLLLLVSINLIFATSLANACAPGESSGVSVNATTGEQITYCIPAAPTPGFDYNPQTNPSAPPAETVLTREQAAEQRRQYEAAAAAAAAAERERIAASTPIVPRVIDPTDPLPTLSNGEKVPGTVVSGQQEITCPAGSGRGIEVNATTGAVSTSCIKSWTAPEVILQQIAAEESINKSKLAALELSKIWNAENPGQQKCFSYGIVSQANQLTESGAVCANPITNSPNSEIIEVIQTVSPTGTPNVNNVAIPKVLVLGNEDSNLIRIESSAKNITASAAKAGAKTVKLAVNENEIGVKEVVLPEKLIGYTVKVTENKKVISAIKLGSTTYTSEGDRTTKLGITTYSSNGTSTKTSGSSTYYSNGVAATKIGLTTYQTSGLTSQQIGETTLFSDGQQFQSIR